VALGDRIIVACAGRRGDAPSLVDDAADVLARRDRQVDGGVDLGQLGPAGAADARGVAQPVDFAVLAIGQAEAAERQRREDRRRERQALGARGGIDRRPDGRGAARPGDADRRRNRDKLPGD